jgi:hypothetical protein
MMNENESRIKISKLETRAGLQKTGPFTESRKQIKINSKKQRLNQKTAKIKIEQKYNQKKDEYKI